MGDERGLDQARAAIKAWAKLPDERDRDIDAPYAGLIAAVATALAQARAEGLEQASSTGDKLVAILQRYCGEFGANEGAVDTLNRLLRERNEARERYKYDLRQSAARAAGEEQAMSGLTQEQLKECLEAIYDKAGAELYFAHRDAVLAHDAALRTTIAALTSRIEAEQPIFLDMQRTIAQQVQRIQILEKALLTSDAINLNLHATEQRLAQAQAYSAGLEAKQGRVRCSCGAYHDEIEQLKQAQARLAKVERAQWYLQPDADSLVEQNGITWQRHAEHYAAELLDLKLAVLAEKVASVCELNALGKALTPGAEEEG